MEEVEEAERSGAAAQRLLSVTCDSFLRLTHDLKILQPSARRSAISCKNFREFHVHMNNSFSSGRNINTKIGSNIEIQWAEQFALHGELSCSSERFPCQMLVSVSLYPTYH